MEEMSLAEVTLDRDIRYVKKANSLIQMNRYIDKSEKSSLSLIEAKLIAFALSKLDPNSEALYPIEIDFDEYWAMCGIKPDSKKHYLLLADAIMNLRSRAAWIMKPHPVTGEPTAVPVSWLESKPMLLGKRAIIRFDPDLAPALLMLKGNYTQYPLNSVMRLTSKYGFALYEFIASMEHSQQPIFLSFQRIAEICDACNYLGRPSDLKKRVILPALKDICQNTPDYEVGYEFIKTGRVTTHVKLLPQRKQVAASQKELLEEGELSEEERWSRCTNDVRSQIGYAALKDEMETGQRPDDIRSLDLIVEVMTDVYLNTKGRYTINGNRIPGNTVAKRYHSLSRDHIEFVLQSIGSANTQIKNPMKYFRTTLFNAPLTMDLCRKKWKSPDRVPNGFGANGNRELSPDEVEAIRQMMLEDTEE